MYNVTRWQQGNLESVYVFVIFCVRKERMASQFAVNMIFFCIENAEMQGWLY
jgi:hypothetical protein